MLRFLYETTVGRVFLRPLVHPSVSKVCGAFLDSRLSRFLIKGFIRNNDINMEEYVEEKYDSFNQFFYRHIKPEMRPMNYEKSAMIAPCDGLLSVYPIEEGLVIPVKQSQYRVADLLRDEKLAKQFDGGFCLVYRLCVNHYHRYTYVETGRKSENKKIEGILHTVRPIALRNGPVFAENSREYTIIETEDKGKLIQMEVGAMLVGKIHNLHEDCDVKRGEEKGYFMYGGSTIIVLVQKDQVKIRPEISESSKIGEEFPIKLGEKVGEFE